MEKSTGIHCQTKEVGDKMQIQELRKELRELQEYLISLPEDDEIHGLDIVGQTFINSIKEGNMQSRLIAGRTGFNIIDL